jgi:Na+-translocating ferredoxin:NAD+ oxidoreductase subunit C
MSAFSLKSLKRFTFPKGIHPPECKEWAEHKAIEVLPTPDTVRIPVLQHLGAPAKISIEARAAVVVGDKIAEAGGPVSANVHASVAGKTAREGITTLPNGRRVTTIPIKADAEQALAGEALKEAFLGGDWSFDPLQFEPAAIAQAAQEAGIVGMGGAAFPSHIKLARNEKRPVADLLINGCECEPFLTADHRLMVESPQSILAGAQLAALATGATRIFICIEDNKPEAIASILAAIGDRNIEVKVMRSKYPQGGEKSLVMAALGKTVPTLGLPLDVGVVVLNVGTAASLARMVLRGMPLTHRIVTVTGPGIVEPKNLIVPIGTDFETVINYCGGLKDTASRIIAGGPMMGFSVTDLSTPVTKGTSGITVLTEKDVRASESTACVRCGMCVDACPLDLVPTKLALAARYHNVELLTAYSVDACMECGCCAYQCPSNIPLVQLIRTGKIHKRNAR